MADMEEEILPPPDTWMVPGGAPLERLPRDVTDSIRCFAPKHERCAGSHGCRVALTDLVNLKLVDGEKAMPLPRFRQALAEMEEYSAPAVQAALSNCGSRISTTEEVRFFEEVDKLRRNLRGYRAASTPGVTTSDESTVSDQASSASARPTFPKPILKPPVLGTTALAAALETVDLAGQPEGERRNTNGQPAGGERRQDRDGPQGAVGDPWAANRQGNPNGHGNPERPEDRREPGENGRDNRRDEDENDQGDEDEEDDDDDDEEEEDEPTEEERRAQREEAAADEARESRLAMERSIRELTEAIAANAGREAQARDASNQILLLLSERGVTSDKTLQAVQKTMDMTCQTMEHQKPGTTFAWKFSGKVVEGNPEHAPLEEFIRQIDALGDARGMSQKARVEWCRLYVRGNALNWFTAQAANERGRSMAFESDWNLCKKYLREQYGQAGACYYIDMRKLYIQRNNEDAEEFYSRVSMVMEGFLDNYAYKLWEMALPKRQGLLMPGMQHSSDEARYKEFKFPLLRQWAEVTRVTDAMIANGGRDTLEPDLRAAAARFAMAYLEEFLIASFEGFRLFLKESRFWFECIDGLKLPQTRKWAAEVVRNQFRKDVKDRDISTRELCVRIKNKELCDQGAVDKVCPPGGGVGAVDAKGDSDEENDPAVAATGAGKKQPKKRPAATGQKQQKKGPSKPKKARVQAAEGDERSERETRTCRYCKKVGHIEKDCWTKHPEQRPEWARGGAAGAVTARYADEEGARSYSPIQRI